MGFTKYIYKVHCKDKNVKDSFIGHTANPTKCKYNYKCHCKFKNGTVYQAIRDNGGWDNWTLTVLEKIDYIQAKDFKDKLEDLKLFHKPTLNRQPKPKKSKDRTNQRTKERIRRHN